MKLIKEVSDQISSKELSEIKDLLKEQFNVTEVELEVSYETSGSIVVDYNDEQTSENSIIDLLQENLARTLSVHPSKITVTSDGIGGYTYTVRTDTFDELDEINSKLNQSSFVTSFNDVIEKVVEDVKVNSVTTLPVEVVIDTTIEGGFVDNPVENMEIIENLLKQDYNVIGQGNEYCLFVFVYFHTITFLS